MQPMVESKQASAQNILGRGSARLDFVEAGFTAN